MANISKIVLPNGNIYNIYDANAIHISDITALMDFKGTKASYSDLPTTGNKVGDVWLISNTGEEYIYDSAAGWVKLGYDIKAASTTHIHNVTVTGTNAPSTVTGSVTVPKVTVGSGYISAMASPPAVTVRADRVLGEDTTFTTTVTPTTTNIKATASGVSVDSNGTASAITALGSPTTATALGVDATFSVTGGTTTVSNLATTTIKNPSVTAVSIPNVTSNTSVTASKVSANAGSAAIWNAKVSSDGVLSFEWTTNTPTAVTATDVSASKVTLGTALSASNVSTSNVTVATGSLSSSGGGAAVVTDVSAVSVAVDDADEVAAVTGYASPTTKSVLTGVKVTAQPTIALATGATAGTGVISVVTDISSATTVHDADDNVLAATGVTIGAPPITLSAGTAAGDRAVAIDFVTIGTETASVTGTAAAQQWTQKSGITEIPNN